MSKLNDGDEENGSLPVSPLHTRDDPGVTRRRVLRASAGGTGLLGTGTVSGHGDAAETTTDYCAITSKEPKMVPYAEGGMAACADDHPATKELQSSVVRSLNENYATVGALIDDGYVPYADFFTAADGNGISHWINPDYLADDQVLDPAKPESVMIDHHWWRPIGVMFIATAESEEIHPPPAVYEPSSESASNDADPCLPWHTHVGLPGRKSWLKYQAVHGDTIDALRGGIPCRTPWMLHIWAFAHPHGVYAEGGLPRENRGGPPAEPAGFETDAVPGEDDLDKRALLDAADEEIRAEIRRIEAELETVEAKIDSWWAEARGLFDGW